MRATRRLAAPLAALILAASPATAIAQNAGDEQYADPFGNSSQSGGGGSSNSGSSGNAGTTGSSGTAGVAGTQAQSTPSAAATGTASSRSSGSSGQLPRTGLDVGIVAALGAALLLGGLALRRRSADARR
jgi:LPXTG-motif cell wall-anchored protein